MSDYGNYSRPAANSDLPNAEPPNERNTPRREARGVAPQQGAAVNPMQGFGEQLQNELQALARGDRDSPTTILEPPDLPIPPNPQNFPSLASPASSNQEAASPDSGTQSMGELPSEGNETNTHLLTDQPRNIDAFTEATLDLERQARDRDRE